MRIATFFLTNLVRVSTCFTLTASVASAAESKKIFKIYNCSREVIQNFEFSEEWALRIGELLDGTIANSRNEHELDEILGHCKAIKATLPEKYFDVSKRIEIINSAVAGKNLDQRTVQILNDFAKPKVLGCSRDGGVINFGYGLAVSLGLATVACETTDGRTIESSEVVRGLGVGIGLTGGDSSYKTSINLLDADGSPLSYVKIGSAAWVAGIQTEVADYNSADFTKTDSDIAGGFGVLTTWGKRTQFLLREHLNKDAVLKKLGLVSN